MSTFKEDLETFRTTKRFVDASLVIVRVAVAVAVFYDFVSLVYKPGV